MLKLVIACLVNIAAEGQISVFGAQHEILFRANIVFIYFVDYLVTLISNPVWGHKTEMETKM